MYIELMKILLLTFRLLLLFIPLSAQALSAVPNTKNSESCPMKLTFEKSSDAQKWGAVNDGVMGGRSSGSPSFDNNHMIFKGIINTNGGGFSSIRRSIEPGLMTGMAGVRMRLRSDGRDYKLSLRTDALLRQRPIAFQAPIRTIKTNEWETVFVPFDSIKASVFGRPLRDVIFDRNEINTIGIIISDGQDGPFKLEVEWIEACNDDATPIPLD